MKKFTILMSALIAFSFAMQGQNEKPPMKSAIFDDLPTEFAQLDNTTIYYSIQQRTAVGPGDITAVSILGKIGNQYYSSTYEANSWFGFVKRAGAGFLSAFQVNIDGTNYDAVQVNAATGTTSHGVTCTTSLAPQGDVAARIIYSFSNTNDDKAVTINAGVWGDIMIGDNDQAPLERLKNSLEAVYGIKMKYSTAQGAPLLCALFGEGVTGATPIDDYWFGYYSNNYSANAIVGNYSTNISNYMQENGSYDCGLGFCWKNRVIEPGETLELSWVISVGEIDYEEPIIPGDDRFEYEVEAYNFDGWNDLSVAHPAHVWGYYEHPYGQNGYIEYQVDGNRSWTRIPTELVSGENFDLPFDMLFNPDITTTHTLELRFNDGLDNIIPMTGLTWTDVRSIPITGLEDRPYTGEPQTFEVTVGDGEPFTIGENGEYTDPGTYSYGIEGVFADNTIGVNDVEFTIGKGQSEIDYTIPEDCVYDGEAHAATVTLVVGDGEVVVNYVNTETGEVSDEAPVLPGTYDVVVSVAETDFYYGIEETTIGTFTIDKAQSEIEYTIPDDVTYDGEAHGATVTLVVGDGDLTVTYKDTATGEILTEAPVEVGTYEVIVEVSETDTYYGIEETVIGSFSILSKHTAVDELSINNEDNGAWYTIDGRRVTAPTERGIYIHNGKKYVK